MSKLPASTPYFRATITGDDRCPGLAIERGVGWPDGARSVAAHIHLAPDEVEAIEEMLLRRRGLLTWVASRLEDFADAVYDFATGRRNGR